MTLCCLSVTFSAVSVLYSQCVLTLLPCCPDNNECESDPCGHGRGLCVNIEGSYKCHCRQGYKHMVQHGRLKCIGELDWVGFHLKLFLLWVIRSFTGSILFCCADVNECLKQDICGVGGQCVNLPGSYKCECHSGFRSKSHRHTVCEGTKTLIIMPLWSSVLKFFQWRGAHYVRVSIICLFVWETCGQSKQQYVKLLLTNSRHKWVSEPRHLSQWAVWEHTGLLRVHPVLAWSWGPKWHLLWWVQPCCTAQCITHLLFKNIFPHQCWISENMFLHQDLLL